MAPKNFKSEKAFVSYFEDYLSLDYFSCDFLFYDDDREVSLIDNEFSYDSMKSKNPIVVYFNLDKHGWETLLNDNSRLFNYSSNKVAYRLTDNDISNLLKENDLRQEEMVRTNFSEQYNECFEATKIKFVFTTILFIFTVIFEYQILQSVFTMKYILEGKEMAVKKVFGYNSYQLFKKSALEDFLTNALAIVSVFLFLYKEQIDIPLHLLISAVVLQIIISSLFFFVLVKKLGAKYIAKIIKGGI